MVGIERSPSPPGEAGLAGQMRRATLTRAVSSLLRAAVVKVSHGEAETDGVALQHLVALARVTRVVGASRAPGQIHGKRSSGPRR